MNYKTALTVTSLLSIVLFLFHWSYEITNGLETGGRSGLGGIVILVVWICGVLLIGKGRAGYIITLVGGILGAGVLYLHMGGHGMTGGRIANTPDIFFWVWTLIALGVSSSVSVILSAYGLWSLGRNPSRSAAD